MYFRWGQLVPAALFSQSWFMQTTSLAQAPTRPQALCKRDDVMNTSMAKLEFQRRLSPASLLKSFNFK